MTGQGQIISASRRTDLPGYHAGECARRLLRLRRRVHSVFFWTRYPGRLAGPDSGLLGELVRDAIENPFVHLTLTGLGGTQLEPRVPATRDVLAQLDGLLAALRGDGERLLWRFDPVLLEADPVGRFAALAPELSARGVRTCIISFPAQLSLKGALDEQYSRAGLSRPGRPQRRALALRLAEDASRAGLTLQACCQPQLLQDCGGVVGAASCISAELAVRMHPRREPLDLPKDSTQRRHCHCAVSHDIGRYGDLCRSGCAYCYSSAGGPEPGASGRQPEGSRWRPG